MHYVLYKLVTHVGSRARYIDWEEEVCHDTGKWQTLWPIRAMETEQGIELVPKDRELTVSPLSI
jgi:hypothetical protein